MNKKCLSMIIALAILLGLVSTTSVYADINDSNSIEQIIVENELDKLECLNKKSDFELFSKGYSKDTINEIRNYKIFILKKVFDLGRYTENELQKNGYSQKQIDSIRKINENITLNEKNFVEKSILELRNESKVCTLSFDNEPINIKKLYNEIRGVGADLYTGLWRDWGNDEDKKSAFEFYWQWVGIPFFQDIDGMAFKWSNNFVVDIDDIIINVSDVYEVPRKDLRIEPGEGFGFEYFLTTATLGGTGSFKLQNEDNKDRVQIVSKYGHSIITITGLGISFDSIGISFGHGVEELNEKDQIFKYMEK